MARSRESFSSVTYKGKAAVSASRNLGLVGVDEDLGVTKGTTTAVTADDLGLSPTHWLLVNELNSSKGPGLGQWLVL